MRLFIRNRYYGFGLAARIFVPERLKKTYDMERFFYVLVLSLGFLLLTLAGFFHAHSLNREIIPGYWNPETMLNLGGTTHGYSIEDVFFMFFIGGIATYVYEVAVQKRIKFKKRPKAHLRAVKFAALAAFLVAAFTRLNYMYALIAFGFGGAAVIWEERKDLIFHSLLGGITLTLIYFTCFEFFNFIFPHFIQQFYTLKNVSGILIWGIPLEEYLYVFGFGLMWAPFYEYEHGEKDADMKK